jgi:hypothetical protein
MADIVYEDVMKMATHTTSKVNNSTIVGRDFEVIRIFPG